jgi:hypothetical protein
MHCNENPIYVIPEKELRGLSRNFHIHVSVSDLYIPRSGPQIFLQQNAWKLGLRSRAIPFLEIFLEFSVHCSVFEVCVGCFVEVAVFEDTSLLDDYQLWRAWNYFYIVDIQKYFSLMPW